MPVCFALVNDHVVTPIDEKPQRVAPDELRRSRNVRENPWVAMVVDHYTEDWSRLGWLQLRGQATLCPPRDGAHSRGVTSLEEKYEQYPDQVLEKRPIIRIAPWSVRSWGLLERPE